MNQTHLSPASIEALAHGREDLVGHEERMHASTCEECARRLQSSMLSSQALSVALHEKPLLAFDADALLNDVLDAKRKALPMRTVILGSVAGLIVAGAGFARMWPSDARDVVLERSGAVVAGVLAIDSAVRESVPLGWGLVAVLMAVGAMVFTWLAGKTMGLSTNRMSAAAITGLLLLLFWPTARAHALDVLGEWPTDERISLDVENVQVGEALQRAASNAHLDLVVHAPQTTMVSVHMHGAVAKDVFVAILDGADLVVERTNRSVSIRPSISPAAAPAVAPVPLTAPTPLTTPIPPTPPMAPVAAERASDRVVMGGNANVVENETVQAALAFGGDVDVRGHVLNDAVAFGGDVRIHCGAIVDGDTVSFGGEVLHDSPCPGVLPPNNAGVHIGDRNVHVSMGDGREHPRHPHESNHPEESWLEDTFGDAASLALVFILGLVMMRIAPLRFDVSRHLLQAKPFRSFGAGVLAVFALTFVSLALVITLIGIPVALFVILAAALAGYVGAAMIAMILGGALPIPALRERPVAQFAVGLVLVLLILRLPGLGAALFACACLAAFGAIVMSRLGTRQLA